jgi:hypothetical protein
LTLLKSIQGFKVSPQALGHEVLAGLIMAIVTIPRGLAGGSGRPETRTAELRIL